MRVTVGIVGVLGLGLTVAVAAAQAPGGAPPRQRAAKLLPPVPLDPSELPAVARAAADDDPMFPATTPVTRPGAKTVASGPGWLGGTDPGVRPAGGVIGTRPLVRPLSAPVADDPQAGSRVTDKPKGASATPPGAARVSADANTPFRGTGANGAPVYAGPPAYRWYGWGSVTPGANPYAPTGQYPKASANWYSITGATPGAFPVPVMNPLRPAPGTEPPAYVIVPNPRMPVVPAPTPPAAPPPSTHGAAPAADLSKVATDIRPPATRPVSPPVLPPVPTLAVLPASPASPLPVDREPDYAPRVDASGTRPIEVPALPPIPVGPAVETPRPAVPAPLPVSVTDDQLKWQPRTDSQAPGDWGPSNGKPATAPQTAPATGPNWQQPGASNGTQRPVARGQIDDNRPDPVMTLIRKLCDKRAEGLDVRWTGSKMLTVCFECRTAPEGQQLVTDISARAELAPYQINFCVLVK
jgi:hypothetical protein